MSSSKKSKSSSNTASSTTKKKTRTRTVTVRTQLTLSQSQEDDFDLYFEDNSQKSTSTATSTRKPNAANATSQSPSRRKRKVIDDEEENEVQVIYEKSAEINKAATSDQWFEKHAPKAEAALCINKKKVASVKEWFEYWFSRGAKTQESVSRILLLAGPPGSGKQTLFNVLAAKYKVTVLRFEEPDNLPWKKNTSNEDESTDYSFNAPYTSVLSAFRSFASDAKRMNSLPLVSSSPTSSASSSTVQNAVLLVNELPLAHGPAQKSERDGILRDLCRTNKREGHNPIVIIHTYADSAIKSDLYLAFPPGFKDSVKVVELNPITTKCTENTLKDIMRREKRTVSSERLNEIITESGGDLRQAIQQLQYSVISVEKGKKLLRPAKKQKMSLPITLSQGSQDSMGSQEPDAVFKDSYFDIHHAVGKVLYAKRDEHTNKPKEDVEKLALHVHANEKTIVSYAHHNLPQFCEEVDDMALMLEDLSFADIVSTTYIPEYSAERDPFGQYHFSIAARTILLNNVNKSTNSYRQIRAPAIRKVDATAKENGRRILGLFGFKDFSMLPNRPLPIARYYSLETLSEEIIPYAKIVGPKYSTRPNAQLDLMRFLHNYALRSAGVRGSGMTGNDETEAVEEIVAEEGEVSFAAQEQNALLEEIEEC